MSVYFDRTKKRWRYEFNVTLDAGQRHRLTKLLPKGWSQAQAHAYDLTATAQHYAIASGVEQRDPPIKDAVALYLNDKANLKSIKKTVEHLNAIAYAFHDKPLSQVAAVSAAINKRSDWSPATIKQRLSWLRAACRWAWKKHGLTKNDPTSSIQMPTVRNARHVYLTRRDMLTLARASNSPQVGILMRVAFYTGLRLGEIGRVEVEGNMLHLADTKNGERRSIPAPTKIRTCLDYLPLSMPRSTLHKYLKAARQRTGIVGNTFHDLRHSTASELINAGVDLYAVGKVLGHKSSSSTDRYSHITAHTLNAAMNLIGKKRA